MGGHDRRNAQPNKECYWRRLPNRLGGDHGRNHHERALAHPMVSEAVKKRLREQYHTLDPVALLAEFAQRRRNSAIASIVVLEALLET
jgi:hypothetical protein